MVAFMPWGGFNTEDGIVISERLVTEDAYSSIYLEEHICNARDTNLGPETVTRDIPGRSEYQLRNLDSNGIVRVGAEVSSGDILVGKVTPRGHIELTPEERLLHAIFGDKARDVKDSSLHMPHGYKGKVIGIQVLSREKGDPTDAGVHTTVKVLIGELRKLSIADKMANRHGYKGVVAKILPVEDMPFLPDGTPIDMIITPLGVFARANVGQILELHLSYAARVLKQHYNVQCFSKVSWATIKKELEKANLPTDGKFHLYDGRTGEKFLEKVAVGYMYVQKLNHMSTDKINARSVGSYSLITQQPLGGKAQHGGQRLGEMEVWALESHGAAHILQEMLTVKSDDVVGRVDTYERITRGETQIGRTAIPASFKVLINELRGALIKTDFYVPKQEREAEDLDLELY
jgi:DNA-directed RNA polymerase subunit beta